MTAKIVRNRTDDMKTKTMIINGKSTSVNFDREHGMYFLGVMLNEQVKPEWSYTYKRFYEIPGKWYQLEFEQSLKNAKGSGGKIISNTLLYKKCSYKGAKDLLVLYE